ncbi:hypothetical protein [Amorphus orientalis]|uniref:Uncharacterized protein n=1 Tax=Amorphus orientalis TaxID=649198 RepID=A0AAE4AUM9_9HYPH|nr:hypothetical protein [Amorphus orientalis]MDQ0317623.1 hypothetical protein [Amorphus orientalis]
MTARDLTEADARPILAALVARSPYRAGLEPMMDDIVRIALANTQLREALARVASRSGVATTGRVTNAELGSDRKLLAVYLEHVFFASPGFLASVGEWPVGRMPDAR